MYFLLAFRTTIYLWKPQAAEDTAPDFKAAASSVLKRSLGDLADNESKISGELLAAQGKPVDIGGYYHPSDQKAGKAMRPSQTLNAIVDAIV